jgi:hypothetical protein
LSWHAAEAISVVALSIAMPSANGSVAPMAAFNCVMILS